MSGGYDLPFEESPRTELDLEGAALCGGVVVMAAALPTAFGGALPCLVFRFHAPDGAFLPPLVLALDPARLQALGDLVNQAAEAAVRRAS